MALVASTAQLAKVPQTEFQFPFFMHLSRKISPPQRAMIEELIQQQPGLAELSDSEEGSLCVIPEFLVEDVTTLERRKCRVIGLPFAERLLRDPSVLQRVHALPLYDFIYHASRGAVCCSGLMQAVKLRCVSLARWSGAKFTDEMGSDAGLLITSRVSLHPESKYQAALQRRIPIVKPSYLEALWEAKAEVPLEQHALPALCGLSVCFGSLKAGSDSTDNLTRHAIAAGAVSEPLDRAEVVIVKDVFAPLYEQAQRLGMLAAPPLWLARCLELRRCVPVTGELEVQNPKSLQLKLVGGPAPATTGGGMQLVEADSGNGNPEPEGGTALAGCVICLLYLPTGETREIAKGLAWRMGANTTMCPFDRAITHVLFKLDPLEVANAIQVSVLVDEDRVSFVELTWLEKCVEENQRVPSSSFPHVRVHYNPVCDMAYAAARGGTINRAPSRALSAAFSDAAQPINGVGTDAALAAPEDTSDAQDGRTAPQPSAQAPGTAREPVQRAPPLKEGGTFSGMTFALLGWLSDATGLQDLLSKLCTNGGTALHGGALAENVLDVQASVIISYGFGPVLDSARASLAQMATTKWVDACVTDNICHSTTAFPHFSPGPGALPLQAMANCAVRITALPASDNRKRRRFEDLAEVVGAKVAQQSSRWAEITHIVCVMPENLDRKTYDVAMRKQIPVVTLQWLIDCYNLNARQPEDKYDVAVMLGKLDSQAKSSDPETTQIPKNFNAAVLSGHDVLISPAALGSNPSLPQMAEELGGTVHTFRSPAELASLLKQFDPSPSPPGGKKRHLVVLVEKEEVCAGDAAFAECVSQATAENQRGVFVQTTWLSETFKQRRRQGVEEFNALPPIEGEDGVASKRQRVGRGEVGEVTYAWQNEKQTELNQRAEDSRARELRTQAAKKVSEGLRLAELRREPRAGG